MERAGKRNVSDVGLDQLFVQSTVDYRIDTHLLIEIGTGKNIEYLVEVANVVNDVTYMNDIY